MPDVRQYGRRILDRENAASIIEESRGPCIDRVPLTVRIAHHLATINRQKRLLRTM